jgi:hypothetical protein
MKRFLIVFLCIAFYACSRRTEVNPNPGTISHNEYVLEDFKFLLDESIRLDTSEVQLKDTSLYNYGQSLITGQFQDDLSGLVKISRFEIANLAQLPAGIPFDSFQVAVPSHIYKDGSMSYFKAKVPLSQNEIQRPYGSQTTESVSIKIPARSRIQVNHRINGYYLDSPFSGVIKNKADGSRIPFNGRWKGLLHYDRSAIRLTQHALE